jgi:hypothetical protein
MVTYLRYAWIAFSSGMLMYAAGLGLFWFSSQSELGTDKTFGILPFGNLVELIAFVLGYAVLGWFANFSLKSSNRLMSSTVGSILIILTILSLIKMVPFPFMEDARFAPVFIGLGVLTVLLPYLKKA